MGNLPRPRSYDGEEGIMLSQAKDALSAVAVAYQPVGSVNVIDRWLISQWVYGAIRAHSPLQPMTGLGLIRSGVSRIVSEVEEKQLRAASMYGLKNTVVTVSLQFIILLPMPNVLMHNRKLGGKDYPYEPETELAYYQEAARKLRLMDLPVESFISTTVEEQKNVPAEVKNLIRYRLEFDREG